jgi:hypothetical protein
MISRLHKSGRATARGVAIFLAALMLVSQSIGAAHFHDGAASRGGVATAVNADSGFCPVCQLALHSPGSITATTAIERGPAVVETVFIAAPFRAESPVFSAMRVRAPPVAL